MLRHSRSGRQKKNGAQEEGVCVNARLRAELSPTLSPCRLIPHQDRTLQEHSAVIIRNISVNEENKIKIVEEGALEPLAALLRTPDLKIQEIAVGCIRNLSVNPGNKVAIVQEGALPALPSLIALLSSTDERIQEQAAVSLRNLSVNPQNEIQIVQDGGLRPLIALRSCAPSCWSTCKRYC
jgi:hypothetical protein